ncbi:MAG: hypothetical protein KAX65_01745 [Caldilineaceae bacterium]|nr:hypothetical protein [Caldilineaceae bacterium]
MQTKTYSFDMDKMPRELARTEVITERQEQIERFSPLRALAQNLSRRGVAMAKVELMNQALATAVDLCLEEDPDGRPANVDHVTGIVIVPLPWGEAGYKLWGLRITECRQMRYILRARAERDRPPLFDYHPELRRWVFGRTWTRRSAATYINHMPITLAEYRVAWDATATGWSKQHLSE